MSARIHKLDRTVVINAPREAVFNYFTDSERFAKWWGAGSTIDPRVGGRVHVRHPEGTEAGGEIVEIQAPERIVFTYGYANGKPMPMGTSVVTIVLETDRFATRLLLTHELESEAARDQHIQGWRFQLSLFSNVVTNETNAGAGATADAWFDTWAEPDVAKRDATLARIAHPDIVFHDRYSNLAGLAEVKPHIAAAQHFMPGMRMSRVGDVKHCQGTVLADFTITGPDGKTHGGGTNVFALGADGRIEHVTGFANPPAKS
jgi:uncharacterized protein YndB with AHSA1/START domain